MHNVKVKPFILFLILLFNMAYEALFSNLETVLSLFYLIWLYGWSKKYLGSAKLAILFAVIVVYLTFFQFKELIWIPVLLFFVAFFFSNVLDKINKKEARPEYLKE